MEVRAEWYWKSGWREVRAHHDELVARYAGDAQWDAWLTEHERFVDGVKGDAHVQSAEDADPTQIKWWPNPGKMKRSVSPDRKSYLEYLDKWFYGRLSQDAHLSGFGLFRRGCFFADGYPEGNREHVLGHHRSMMAFTTLTLFLAMICELLVEVGAERAHLSKAQFVWTVLGEYWGEAKELYEERYQALLSE